MKREIYTINDYGHIKLNLKEINENKLHSLGWSLFIT